MVDAVNTQILLNNQRNLEAKFTNLSDSTGEAAVVKIDPTSGVVNGDYSIRFNGQQVFPGIHWKIMEIDYDIKAMTLSLIWDQTAPTNGLVLAGFGFKDFRRFGGLSVPVAAGATGILKFTTAGQMANSAYSVIIRGVKGIPQS